MKKTITNISIVRGSKSKSLMMTHNHYSQEIIMNFLNILLVEKYIFLIYQLKSINKQCATRKRCSEHPQNKIKNYYL